ncbi:hypothetical protein CHS0354_004019 [Potamilus streckersoni]|uniref:IgGFc-binding protein N-terminal domain-containing protein n=1 Tax=Potamilus streckersoni TaxID=2493646 RepID=A0AAE0S0M5_9BIVA|nr:hypothetical protein CHS0354_004019 [Potamilus streckersoni]
MENLNYGTNRTFPLELYITTQEQRDVHVTVTTPKWSNPALNETFTIRNGEVHKVLIDDILRMIGSDLSSKAIHVTADAEVVCYGANKMSLSNDVFLGIPTDALGTEYYAVTHCDCDGIFDTKSEVGIASTNDGTKVIITLPKSDPNLSVTLNNTKYGPGDSFKVTMNRYDTLQLQSDRDLTGVHIVSDKPIATFSGNVKTNIGLGQSADHLVEQLTSVDRWGRQFVSAPIPARTVGDIFKIVASEDNTVIRITGLPPITLAKAGEAINVTLPSDQYKMIKSDKPVLVTQFVQSEQDPHEPADPSMMILPPYELFGSDYTFTTPEYSRPDFGNDARFRYENLFMLVADSSEKDGLLLDGKPLPKNLVWHPISGTSLSGTNFQVSHGTHTVRHTNPLSIFGGYLYGHAYHESFAFPTGMRLATINKNCTPSATQPGDGIDNDCDGKIDEELCTTDNKRADDDGDGKNDEDCVKVTPSK